MSPLLFPLAIQPCQQECLHSRFATRSLSELWHSRTETTGPLRERHAWRILGSVTALLAEIP